MSDNRRRAIRVPFDCPLSLTEAEGTVHRGRVVDLSVEGLQARMENGESPSGQVRVVVDYVCGTPSFTVEADARVVRREEEGTLGLAFQETSEQCLEDLRRLVRMNMGEIVSLEDEDDEGPGGKIEYWYSRPR